MAIFIALIFQVLFVFFAMAINIGLVVHDKINLQNAVDLAAYYGAQRQAEWLNVMAHQNYQIRQAYKLLAWRYHVLGTMGQMVSPVNPLNPNFKDEPEDVLSPVGEVPIVCIAYKPNWGDVTGDESLCKRNLGLDKQIELIGALKVMPVINFTLPTNFVVRDFTIAMNRAIFNQCLVYGGFNYLYANLIKFAYRQDQFRLKQSILAIAQNLARGPNEIIDLNGDPVLLGVQNTLVKNLTRTNQSSIADFHTFNSIQGMRPDQWLNELKVNMNLIYMDITASTGNGGCATDYKQSHEFPQAETGIQALKAVMKMNEADLEKFFQDPPPEDLRRMSLGFEKNPWMKVYYGVRAKTRPRQLFFPFGDPVQFEAVAYASPFGGKMGPWYGERWPQGAPSSSGNPIDKLVVPLVGAEVGSDNVEQIRLLPNYSRYPGDSLGMNSKLAQAGINGLHTFQSSMGSLGEIFAENAGKSFDFLSWDGEINAPLRRFEIAAVSPDLFDITYYSIEPNFARTYLPKLRQVAPALGIPTDTIPRGDLGHRDSPAELSKFSVQDQLYISGEKSLQLGQDSGLSRFPLHRDEAFYFVRDRAHLLTSWVNNDAVSDFSFPEARFGQCQAWDDDLITKIPGSCVGAGGRVGYSVKIINGQHLRSSSLQYGGPNQRGAILNPPPLSW